MMRTATNVAGQIVVPILVAASEKILDQEAYDHPTSIDGDAARDGEPNIAVHAPIAE
ncbi:MAG TPA: hypothetical protein VNO21_06665 [Polyangiaceae bacterium]|nr:hypothetical protein [Polyangiaceae bacterium]